VIFKELPDNQISIIIPTYNESENICSLLESISENLPKNSQTEAIVVDDNSPDGTAKIAENYKSIKQIENYSISVIQRKAKEGLSPAFKETVKLGLAPLLASLSILNHVDIDSEQEMLGYGIGIILMNIGMYFVAPAIVISRIRKYKI